jgi:hypothetical protein
LLLLAAALAVVANTNRGRAKLEELGLGFINVLFRRKS